jgi:hypothetical protein
MTHFDYLGLKAIIDCVAERCTGEIFSASYSRNVIIRGCKTKDLVLQPAGQSPDRRWLHIINVESGQDVQVLFNLIDGIPVDSPLTFTAGVNAMGVMGGVISNNMFKAVSIPSPNDFEKIASIYYYESDPAKPRADLIISNNYIENVPILCWTYGDAVTGNITVENNILKNAVIHINARYNSVLEDVIVKGNIVDSSLNRDAIAVISATPSSPRRGNNIIIEGNVVKGRATASYVASIRSNYASVAKIVNNIVNPSNHLGISCLFCTYALISHNYVKDAGVNGNLKNARSYELGGVDYAYLEENVSENPNGYFHIYNDPTVNGQVMVVRGHVHRGAGTDIKSWSAYALVLILEDNEFYNGSFSLATTPLQVIARRNRNYDTENFKSTGVSVPVGTGGAYGVAVSITSPSGRITLPRVKITWGGTFATGETVTVKVEAVYSDGSTAYVEKSATATGSQWLTDDDVLALIAQGKDIVKLNVYAKSSAPSTSVTVTVDAYGKG